MNIKIWLKYWTIIEWTKVQYCSPPLNIGKGDQGLHDPAAPTTMSRSFLNYDKMCTTPFKTIDKIFCT